MELILFEFIDFFYRQFLLNFLTIGSIIVTSIIIGKYMRILLILNFNFGDFHMIYYITSFLLYL